MVKEGSEILTAEEWQGELDNIDKRIEDLAKTAGKGFSAVEIPDAYKDVSDTVIGYLNGKVTREEAWAKLVENKPKLTEEDYNRQKVKLENPVSDNDPLKNPIFKTLLGSLDDMHKAGQFLDRPFRNDPTGTTEVSRSPRFSESIQTLAAVQKQFILWMENHPDANEAQILETFRALTKPTDNDLAAMSLTEAWTKEGGWQRAYKHFREGGAFIGAAQTAAGGQKTPGAGAAEAPTPEQLDRTDKDAWEQHRVEGGSWEEFLEVKKEQFDAWN
jgi:hypothetical protein